MLINAYSTLGPVLAPPPQAGSASVRGLDDPALAPHLGGFVNYVLGHGDGQMTAARYHLMRHVQRVRQHYLFELAETDIGVLQPWLLQANAVCFLEDGSVRDPAGRVLLGDAPDPQAQVPYPADAGQRRARTNSSCRPASCVSRRHCHLCWVRPRHSCVRLPRSGPGHRRCWPARCAPRRCRPVTHR